MIDKLVTDRLVLRRFSINDAEEMFSSWANDSEVTRYMTWNPHKNVEETKYIINLWLKEYEDPKTVRYAITLKDSGTLIGSIDVVHIDEQGRPEIGYCLSRKYWNKGYMTEACNKMIELLFGLGYKEILIEADVRNIGSNRVIEKCGFIYTHQETRVCSSFKPEMVTVNWYKKTLRQ